MATGEASGNPLNYLHPQPPGDASAFFYHLRKMNRHALRLGILIALVIVQVFFLLESYFNSPIFPGNWSSYTNSYIYYLILDILSFGMVALLPLVNPNYDLRIQPGGFAGFGFCYSLFGIVAWGLVLLALQAEGAHFGVTGISDTVRLQQFVFYGIFVGPSEELFFRVALPPYAGWVLGSGIAFGVFHILSYSTGMSGLVGVSLYLAVFEAAIIGIVLYFLYDRFGVGASIGAHTAYDLTTTGIISTLSIAGLHLALFPV